MKLKFPEFGVLKRLSGHGEVQKTEQLCSEMPRKETRNMEFWRWIKFMVDLIAYSFLWDGNFGNFPLNKLYERRRTEWGKES